MKVELIAKYDKYELCKNNDFYFIKGLDYVDMKGTKEEVITELTRWKNEVDCDNTYMRNMEELFIKALTN